jgi:predicted nucleotidyltransferase
MIQNFKEAKKEHVRSLHEELARIKSKLIKMGAYQIILFGSAAREDLGLISDIDIIVIMESDKNFIDRLAEFYQEIQPRNADILIYTPAEFNRMKNENLFIKHVLKEGKVIYERQK